MLLVHFGLHDFPAIGAKPNAVSLPKYAIVLRDLYHCHNLTHRNPERCAGRRAYDAETSQTACDKRLALAAVI
jgi:hypothetical protein